MAEEKKPPLATSGLLSGILTQTRLGELGVTPQLSQREIVVELTTDQFRTMLLQNADARAKDSVTVELHEGKLVLRIRLW